MRLEIRQQPQTVVLLCSLLGLTLALGVLNWLPVAGDAAKLLLDGLWLILLVYLIRFGREAFSPKLWTFSLWFGGFLLITLLAALVQGQKPWYYLWGVRNNFRFCVVFLAAAAFLRKEGASALMNLLETLFWLNIPVTFVQFFFLGISGDNLGGLLGTHSGVNGDTNLFFLAVITHSILKFLDGEESAWRCLGKCAASLLIAAMAELKFFFVLFLLILVLALPASAWSWRKVGLILGGILCAVAGAVLLTLLFPRFAGWFSLSWFWKTAAAGSGYTDSGDLNRLSAISRINGLFFRNALQRIFGLGLGACDTSGFSFLNTPFYQTYGWLHYNWMSHSFWYLEMGWTGLAFFFGTFLLIIRFAGNSFYGRQSRILATCCLLVGIYNASLRTEMAYLMYTVLALPFVRREET